GGPMDVAVRTVDYHTGGEPFRIVPEPPVRIGGTTVAERRVFAATDPAVDGLRRLLCSEPRGHADMYGGLVVPPDDDGADLGVLGVGGASSASVDAAGAGLRVVPDDLPALIAIGREVKWALNDSDLARHPSDDRLSGVYGTILVDDLGTRPDGSLHQRNVTI